MAVSRAYDGTTAVTLTGGRLEGVEAGDAGLVGFTLGAGTVSDKAAGNGKSVSVGPVTLTGARAGNYTAVLDAQSASPVVDIPRKPIGAADIVVTAPSKVYDGTDAATLNAQFKSGVIVGGDAVTIALTGRYSDASVGNGKPVTVTGWSLGGADAANYALEAALPTGITGVISNAGDTPSLGGGGASAPTPPKEEEPKEEEPKEEPKEELKADAGDGTRVWINPFADVDESAWYYGDIEYAVANGLFAGTGETAFSPNTPMTRGMLATVLGRLYGADVSAYTAGDFSDVEADRYYAPYVAWAGECGLVFGVGDGMFAPDAEITRQDLAVIFARYAAFAGIPLPEAQETAVFADEADMSDYAVSAARVLSEAGIISGRPGKVFDPNGKATRAEVAAILHRFSEAAE
jgi:hypothetical protein